MHRHSPAIRIDSRLRRAPRAGRRCAVSASLVAAAACAANAPAQQGCGEWSFVEAPADVIAVTEVQVRSADEAWAFGSYPGLIRWDGTSWSVFPIGGVSSFFFAAQRAVWLRPQSGVKTSLSAS